MDIFEMIEKGIPIYVINRSATVLGTPHLIMLEFPNPSGGHKPSVKLPPIQYPINLSQRVAPASSIGMCQEFLDLVNRGVLEVVDPDKARRILANPEAQAAVKHAFEKLDKRRMRPSGVQAKKPDFKVVNGGARTTESTPYFEEEKITASTFARNFPGSHEDDRVIDVASVPVQEAFKTASTINARVMQICADLQGNPELKQDYLLEIKSLDPDGLTDDDLGYMIDNLRGFDTITAYIRGLMAKRVGGKVAAKGKAGRVGKQQKDSAADAMAEELDD